MYHTATRTIGLLLVATATGLFLANHTVSAATEWDNPAGGNWNVNTNWDPDTFPVTGDVSINLDGTYTVVANVGVNLGDLALGTTSTSGTQTLSLSTFSGFNAASMTIGANGSFLRHHDGNVGIGSLTIQSGGLFSQSNSNKSVVTSGGTLTVDAGGQFAIASGWSLGLTANTSLIINGQITGDGGIVGNANGITYSGTGTIGGGGTLDLSFRQTTWSGSLTVDKDITATSAFNITDGDQVTLNGTFTNTGGTRSFGSLTSGGSITLLGSGDINITSLSPGSELRFGGATIHNNAGGTLTVGGNGGLNFHVGGVNHLDLTAAQLNLNRHTTITGSGDGGLLRLAGGNAGKITVTGHTLTLGDGAPVFVENRFFMTKALQIQDGATLAMAGGTFMGNVSNTTVGQEEVQIGVPSSGTLALTADTTSVFQTVGDSDDHNNLRIRLGANASTTAGSNAVLELRSVDVYIDITNPANWGWASAGTLRFVDVATGDADINRDGQFEALNSDYGNVVNLNDIDFVINRLAFATNDMTFTLMDNVDNDGNGADTALYVRTLDLSAMTGGTLNLAGIQDGVVYYESLLNPNNVTFDDTQWVQIIPEPASLLLMGAGLMMFWRRPKQD